ncbi:hypothetical protein NEPAR06_1347 [Nematocida parisii]|uniref:uncharacterized protein n=1 Tax=Nematocida parisii (strain ERTm1 / ATCC PRA-289) TaxID=881290 RepID=UPI000264B964|nr:uncharacterized protein NEPG_01536 [Nematocida parisii ERTm1]KAI5129208.1 hypothetical protein NEPAR08_1502 [Nematocida parisii]EIJ93964.1 hypothetical protein NEPG_01536 [Nematocida parisii ERTm1]KAI5129546.1 hypothetical protein NEPAR03_1709 [Nematocida parisii]KAI5143866.1 hypothetical protein NEPAR07_0915 [Nematocida parisii]KAI5144708.1 hypothetical protein NEPAR04_2204 [Nematocida parisii]|eukprot:XP_013059364.1 hypothetical protein NEPG_01536 [Nematocida parisii ERTm1]
MSNKSLMTVLKVLGPVILPILFGMCLTSINVLCNIPVLYTSTESKLDQLSHWEFVSPALFMGTFTLSLVIFISGMYRIIPHPYFKYIFTTSAVCICISNILFVYIRNNILLSICRYFIGIGTGIACALGPVYYTDLLGMVNGSKVSSLQGLFINLGILIEGVISGYYNNSTFIFKVIAGISFISIIINILFTENSKKQNNLRIIRASGDVNVITRHNPKLFIISCLIMQVVQQMTGINPILSNRNGFFIGKNTVPEHFFNMAGLIGTALSSIIMFKGSGFKEVVFISGIVCTVTLGVLGVSNIPWCSGVYLLFFSLGLANLPWILPGMLLQEESDITTAAGLGSLANSAVSCIALSMFTNYKVTAGINWVFFVFSTFSFIEGVFGYFLVRVSERQGKKSSGVEVKELLSA